MSTYIGILIKFVETFQSRRPAVYISKQWMCRFYTFAEPGPIDNSDFLCRHGSVDPDRAVALEQLTVVLPAPVYDYLRRTFGGCPPVTQPRVCPACQAMRKRIAAETEMLRMKADGREETRTHLLSTVWYGQWKEFVRRGTTEPPGPIDNSKLVPSCMQSTEYTEVWKIVVIVNCKMQNICSFKVSEEVWNFFHSIYGGGPEIRIRQKPLLRCSSESSVQTPEMESADALKQSPQKPEIADKSMYSHGEPMEVSSETAAKEAEVKEEPLEVCRNVCTNGVIENGDLNGLDGSGMSSSDEMTQEESSRMEKAYKTRRRRKDLVNAYL